MDYTAALKDMDWSVTMIEPLRLAKSMGAQVVDYYNWHELFFGILVAGTASFAGGPGRSITVARCVFNANEVNAAADDDASGGAIYTANTDLVVTDSVFVGNEAISAIGDSLRSAASKFSK